MRTDGRAETRQFGRMKTWPKSRVLDAIPSEPAEEASAVVQVEVWMAGISPTVWRRLMVPTPVTRREVHGVIRVTMGLGSRHRTGGIARFEAHSRNSASGTACPSRYRPLMRWGG
jgi:hypothetical protein